MRIITIIIKISLKNAFNINLLSKKIKNLLKNTITFINNKK